MINQCLTYLVCASGLLAFSCNSSAEVPRLTEGTLTLKTGDYEVSFLESASWTLDTLNYKGIPLITPTGANQTVVKLLPTPEVAEKDQWIGTKHGLEVVESVMLKVDGKSYELKQPLTAPAGTNYEVVKVSRFGPFRGHWEVKVTPTGIKETASFELVEDNADKVAYIYVFMHCWSPEMTDWMAVLKDGTDIVERFPSEASKRLQKAISMLGVFSETESAGAVVTYPKAYEGYKDRQNFLNNFPGRHNKHYLTVSREALTKETYTCTIQGFQASPDDWRQVALGVAKNRSAAQ
jgi:hypothetical protein